MLWLAIIGYVAVLLGISFRRFDRFFLIAYDLSIFDQAVWLISQGYEPFVTVRGLHILADHFSLILYLLAPLYWLWDSPKALLAAQTLALALGALPVYGLACRRTHSAPIALVFAVVYLLYPAVQWTNAYEFHPENFAISFLLGAFYFLTVERWHGYFALLALAALTKETVGISIIGLGLYAMFINRRIGWLTVGLGAASLIAAFGTMRHFNGGAPSPYFWLYSDYGDSPSAIVLSLLSHPAAVVSGLNTELNQVYLFRLLFPVIFLPLLAPEVLVIAVPALLSNLLSNRGPMHDIHQQYTALITPFIFAAAIIGFDRWRRWGNRLTTAQMTICLAIFAVDAATWGPAWVNASTGPRSFGRSPSRADGVRNILGEMPPEASVAAQASLVPFLSHRRSVYMFPNPFYRVAWGCNVQALQQLEGRNCPIYSPKYLVRAMAASSIEYLAFSPSTIIFPLPNETYSGLVESALQSPAYGIVALGQDVILLRRGADHRQGLRRLARRSGVPVRNDRDIGKAYAAWIAGQFAAPESSVNSDGASAFPVCITNAPKIFSPS